MARNQKLINYHTGDKTRMPSGSSVDFGEIVVRHNAESPELLIKIGDDSFGVFQASGAVKTAIEKAVSDAKLTLDKDISDLETSLTGHVADFDKFKGDVEKTYATKEELKSTSGSIITAYEKAVGDAKIEIYDSATTFATNAVNVAKTDLNGSISSLETSLTGHVADFDKFKGDVEKTYATKEELKSTSGSIITAYEKAVGDAKIEIYDSATTFATSAVTVAKGELNSAINAVASNVETLSGAVSSITENYVTTGGLSTTVEELEGKISSAKTEAIGKASGYTDTQIAAAKKYSDDNLTAATQTLTQSITNVSSSVSTLSGNVHTRIEGLKTDLTDTINEKVATAYRFQGSCTYAELASKEKVNGYVWNVTDAHGNVPAGTNYAWSEEENKWDALGGIVDLSPYAKTEDVNQSITNLASKVGEFSSATVTEFASLKEYADDTFATKTALQTAQNDITTAYTQAIANAKKEATDASSAYTDTQVSAAKEALKQSIETVDGRVTSLSASTVTIQGVANSAIQTASILDGDTCKVSVNKEGTELQFDFRNLVVDCGEF